MSRKHRRPTHQSASDRRRASTMNPRRILLSLDIRTGSSEKYVPAMSLSFRSTSGAGLWRCRRARGVRERLKAGDRWRTTLGKCFNVRKVPGQLLRQ